MNEWPEGYEYESAFCTGAELMNRNDKRSFQNETGWSSDGCLHLTKPRTQKVVPWDAGCLCHPTVAPKALRVIGKLLVFSLHWKDNDSGFQWE